MKCLLITTTITLFVIVLIQSVTPIKMKLPKCRGQKIKVTVEDVDNIATCINQALSGEGEDEVTVEGLGKAVPKNSMACMGKCFMEKEGLIDDKGMPSKEIMISRINSTFPPDVVLDMDAAMEKCVDTEGGTVDPKDTSCESYVGLTQCMIVSFVEVCKTPKIA